MITDNIIQLIGNTPMLRASNFAARMGSDIAPLAKLEYLNPAGSIKDRTALSMIEDAERQGILKPGATIIEPTSGNTGVGMSMICAVKGYRLILTMPDTMSMERINLLRAHGAEVVLTDGTKGMDGAVAESEKLKNEIDGAVILGQFVNPANPLAHYTSTAEEIWADTQGKVDAVIAGIGTAGTLCGIGKRLKELNPKVKIIGVEPASSPLITKGVSGPHKLQGIGANFIPKIYDANVVDCVEAITNEDAITASRLFAQTEGILIGYTGGAALVCAIKVIKENPSFKNVVAILPDGGERYLSTDLYHDQQ